MMSSVQFCKAFLAFLICHAWLPSLVSSQSTTMATSSNQSPSASVSMTTDSSSTSAMSSSAVPAPVPASTTSVPASTNSVPPSTTVTTVSTMGSTSMPPATDSTTNSMSTVSATTSSGSTTSSASSVSSSSSSTTTSTTSTTTTDTSNSTISCRTFYCDGSNCYSMFMNTNTTACPSGCDYCEIRQWNESMYQVGCADSCNASRCVNDTQVNCVKDCCNMTGCLNTTLQGMERTPTTTVTTTTTQATTTTTTTPATTMRPSNGKKCKSLICTGADCYTTTQAAMAWCYDSLTYCELKKWTEGSTPVWMAGCATNCSAQTACTATAQTCHQECCEASAAGDCLKLDGKVNMPNSGAIHSPYMVLLVPSLMAWLLVFGELL